MGSDGRTVVVTGATGYVGGRLVPVMLDRGWRVRCLVRRASKLEGVPWRDRVEVIEGDVVAGAGLHEAFSGADGAFYLVHGMGSKGDFRERDRAAAHTFGRHALAAGLSRIVYLGGMGDETQEELSGHLRSRHEVGEILAASGVPTTELRAAVVIGSGSASFEMLRHLVETLPVMITPSWVRTRCQPIGIADALDCLAAAMEDRSRHSHVWDIGGADVVTYQDMMQIYAQEAGLRRRIVIPVGVLSPRLSSHWIGFVTPIPPELAKPLVDSLRNEVVAEANAAPKLLEREPIGVREAIRRALRRTQDLAIDTTWADAELWGASPADPWPGDPDWAGGKLYEDRRQVDTSAPPDAVWREVCAIGGDAGWPSAEWLWWIRGVLDRLVGGIGMRRGRRHPTELRVGDPLDFWRVETLVPDRVLRLRAEMKLPGDAWLEWQLESLPGGGTRLVQLARFHPRGLLGVAYWYAVAPFHAFVFEPMAQRLAHRAATP